ncbi:MAG: glycoside hydrolase family 127 protein [Verrucomicrobiales bacterium]|nr:glycoside hydrolase family 127 protein [Verrucomicrobiales bacterium]
MKTRLAVILASALSLPSAVAASRDYPIRPVPFTDVRVDDAFWTPRIETNRQTTVWYCFKKCEETGRISNFARAGGQEPGPFQGCPFDDSDVYKVIQGAAYTLATHPDPKLDAYLDELIAKIAAAQESDGYLYTARTLKSGHSRAGKDRWLNERGAQTPGEDSHELYNLGHLYEAAAAHFEATGKTNLLQVARRSADLVSRVWGKGKLEIPSGHQEIEIGLIKLFRVTSDAKYLDLAKFLLDCRGNGRYEVPAGHYGPRYYSDHLPVTQQTEAVGHSVRSTYMYSAMADIAAILADSAYAKAADALWQSVVGRKLYLTGGIGSDATTEGFGPDFALPNDGYNETCAAIGNALWNQRMFLLHGDAQYIDVLERTLYNGFLAGVAFTGDRFFYPNPLVCDGKRKFNQGSLERAPWFGCSCCPVNDVRFIPEIAGSIYATRADSVYVNLYVGCRASMEIRGTTVSLRQTTQYPFDGKVSLAVDPPRATRFALHLRIPGWARNEPLPSDLYRYSDNLRPAVSLAVNGSRTDLRMHRGYAELRREWKPGDVVTLDLEMPVRRVVANPKVQAAANSIAVERGPLVYCAEGADNPGTVMGHRMSGKTTFNTETRSDLLGGLVAVKALSGAADGRALTMIPYYAWAHRGPNEMRVWFPFDP